MKSGIQITAALCMLIAFTNIHPLALKGQYSMPAVMDTATLKEQLDYVQERTRIYNDYRAIREDIFLKMKANSIDSLDGAKKIISDLQTVLRQKNSEISSLNSNLESTNNQLDEAIKNRNALHFLGIQMDKILYNSIMWFIVGGLALLAVILFIMFRRNRAITVQYRNELNETRENFETYRKEARERYEKLVVNHHNEIMKLKGL
ncbi:MAG TPA: hypothetical protein ENN61_02310 [Bacteroidaceae bacterium]|nr:hypothetical protein [Bacteroidaceae bacterium]